VGQIELDLADVGGNVAGKELSELGFARGLALMVMATPLLLRVVLHLEDLDLTKLGCNGDQVMIAIDVIHVDVQDVRVKFALAINKELRCGVLNGYLVPASFLLVFKVDLVDVELGIITTHNEVVIVLKFKLNILLG
jgi:hypothetical protein